MKATFVKTDNTARLLEGVSAVKARGAGEACLMVIDGEPGLGKTETVQWWATQQNAIYLRAKRQWSPAWMMRELLQELNVVPQHAFQRMFAQAIEALGHRAADGDRDGNTFAVIVDEVDYFVRSGPHLDTLRDLSDILEVPIFLVGMGRVRDGITRFPQVASRVARYVEFKRATLEDVTRLANGLLDGVTADPALIQFIHAASGGLVREIKEALANIERFGRRNGSDVTLASMAGQVLMNDRKSGKPILVRA